MAGYWIAAQLAVGSAERSAFTDSQIEDAIARGRDLARLDALLLWPAADPRLMERLIRACRSRHVRPYLWFPVLCDLPGAEAPVASLVMSCTGNRGHGRSGAWKDLADGDEHFLFACPNNERFLEPALHAFEALVDSLAPDGVMLDRIRFPSPANGFESLLGCFCESCRAEFRNETGESMDGLRGKASALLADLREKGPQEFFTGWADSGSPWKAAGLQALAAFRSRSIVRAVRRFSTQARSRGREVGLDLFSPSLAPLVGQDYAALSELCDWIKPMTYRRAVGPAGLPLEIACLRRGVQELLPDLRSRTPSFRVRAPVSLEAAGLRCRAPAARPARISHLLRAGRRERGGACARRHGFTRASRQSASPGSESTSRQRRCGAAWQQCARPRGGSSRRGISCTSRRRTSGSSENPANERHRRCSSFPASARSSPASRRWTASTSRSAGERFTRCSGKTVPANPRWSRSLPGSTAATGARSCSKGLRAVSLPPARPLQPASP